jgi:hypothetical protein
MPDVHRSTRPHHNRMINQRLQFGGSSVLPTTQQLTIQFCQVARFIAACCIMKLSFHGRVVQLSSHKYYKR